MNCKEEEGLDGQHICNQERNSSLDQQDSQPPQIKEEQEELCISQEGEQLVVKQEAEGIIFWTGEERLRLLDTIWKPDINLLHRSDQELPTFDSQPIEFDETEAIQEDTVGTNGAAFIVPLSPADEDEQQSEDGKKRKEKSRPLDLTEEQKADIAEWYRSLPFLYNSKLNDYKDLVRKAKAYDDKARELGYTGKQLQTWIKTQRDEVGKLTDPWKKKSGSEVTQLSERQEICLQNFGFLQAFMRRHARGKHQIWSMPSSTASIASKTSTRRKRADEEEEEKVLDEERTSESDVSEAGGRPCSAASRQSKAKGGPYKSRKEITSTTDEGATDPAAYSHMIQQIKTLQEQLLQIRDKTPNMMEQSRRHFAEMLFSETMQMDEVTFANFRLSTLQSLFSHRGIQLQQQQQYPGQYQMTLPACHQTQSQSQDLSTQDIIHKAYHTIGHSQPSSAQPSDSQSLQSQPMQSRPTQSQASPSQGLTTMAFQSTVGTLTPPDSITPADYSSLFGFMKTSVGQSTQSDEEDC